MAETRFVYEDVLEDIDRSKAIPQAVKDHAKREIMEMIEKKKINLIPCELCTGSFGKLGIIFTWQNSPSGYDFWSKINALI